MSDLLVGEKLGILKRVGVEIQRRLGKEGAVSPEQANQFFETDGFAEFIDKWKSHPAEAGQPARAELSLQNPDDRRRLSELHETFVQKAEVNNRLKDIYAHEIKQELGIDLPPEAIKAVEAYIEKKAVEVPEFITNLRGEFENYQNVQSQVAQLEQQIGKYGSKEMMQEQQRLAQIIDKSEGWFTKAQKRIFGQKIVGKEDPRAIKAKSVLFEQGLDAENIKVTLKKIEDSLTSTSSLDGQKKELLNKVASMRALVRQQIEVGQEVHKHAAEAAHKVINEKLMQSRKKKTPLSMDDLASMYDMADKLKNQSSQEHHAPGSRVDYMAAADAATAAQAEKDYRNLDKRFEKGAERLIIELATNLPSGLRLSEAKTALATLKQYNYGGERGQAGWNAWLKKTKDVLASNSQIPGPNKLIMKLAVEGYII